MGEGVWQGFQLRLGERWFERGRRAGFGGVIIKGWGFGGEVVQRRGKDRIDQ